MSLFVDIEKKFKGFALKVKFHTKRASWGYWELPAAAKA